MRGELERSHGGRALVRNDEQDHRATPLSGAQLRILPFLTALSWAVGAFFVYRFYRLSLWNKRVSSALEAVTAPSVARQELGWRSVSHLATAEGLPMDDRAWLTAVLDDLHEQGDRQPQRLRPVSSVEEDDSMKAWMDAPVVELPWWLEYLNILMWAGTSLALLVAAYFFCSTHILRRRAERRAELSPAGWCTGSPVSASS